MIEDKGRVGKSRKIADILARRFANADGAVELLDSVYGLSRGSVSRGDLAGWVAARDAVIVGWDDPAGAARLRLAAAALGHLVWSVQRRASVSGGGYCRAVTAGLLAEVFGAVVTRRADELAEEAKRGAGATQSATPAVADGAKAET